jgi:hypothetical protein
MKYVRSGSSAAPTSQIIIFDANQILVSGIECLTQSKYLYYINLFALRWTLFCTFGRSFVKK